MTLTAERAAFTDIEPLRALFRAELNCQFVHDSILRRGLADPYLLRVDGQVAGYGGVWNMYDPGRVMEFYPLPDRRALALPLYQALLEASAAVQLQAQTNLPLMLLMLMECGHTLRPEAVLFDDAFTSRLPNPGVTLRPLPKEEASTVFTHHHEPVGDWALEADGEVVATGGALFHYNPPYGDLYMEVAEPHRQRGYGAYLIQELKRIGYERGNRPAARCDPANVASRNTMAKAGMLPCGRILVADVKR